MSLLCANGIDIRCQIVARAIGNDAVRPGEISLKDSTCVAATMFLVNMIPEIMLSHSGAEQAERADWKSLESQNSEENAEAEEMEYNLL